MNNLAHPMSVRVALALCFFVVCRLYAQEALSDALPSPVDALTQPIPESAWLDLRQNASRNSKTQNAPAWVEALTLFPGEATENGITPKSIFRIRVTQPSPDYQVLFFRLFFDDKPSQQPELIAWDESGTHMLRSGTLGVGMNLPSSDSVLIPMTGASAIDIEVPGDGKTIRAAYLDWMTSSEVVHPVNSDHRDMIPEPFSSAPALHAPPEDVENFGTVTATLAADPMRIDAQTQQSAAFEFPIEAEPLTALLTFEIANPSVDAPPEVHVNGQDIGPVSLTLPDLADPGYRGEMEALTPEMHFHYTGWLRAQKIVPATALKVGTNNLTLGNPAGTGSSAIRATQIQLKYIWDKSDYLLHASH
jgi:hypothetical protein